LNDHDVRQVKRITKKNRNKPIEQITDSVNESLSTSISTTTVHNYLHESRQEKQKIPEDNEIYDSANSDGIEEMISYFDEEFENNSESLFQLLINNMKNYKAKRPLTYHGNSTRTQKRRKASTKENINKNGQTLDQFFILEKNSSKEMTQDNDSQSPETVNNELEIVLQISK
ncbi:12550_t:CDS:2, partial [Entrophospora sp. SA101]